jgi:hypothetical protein
MKLPRMTQTIDTPFSSEIGSLYPVLEEPEYMDESEESALEAALHNILLSATDVATTTTTTTTTNRGTATTTTTATTSWEQERNNVASMPFRGSKETMEAIANDQITCNNCFVCHETVFCIQDACYMICPQCYTYFPNTSATATTTTFGLAIGFDIHTLWECQADLLAMHENDDEFLK